MGHTDDMTDVYLINKKSEIEIMDILNNFTTESSISTMYENEGASSALANMLHKVAQVILDSIASVFDMLSNLFSKDDKISKEEYLRSRQGEMVFDYDIVKQQKYINSKAKEGNNLMRRLLKGENVHNKVVDFVNGVARTLESPDGRNKVYATAAPIVYGYQVDFRSTMKEFSDLNKTVLPKIDYADSINKEDIKMTVRTFQNLTARSNNLVSMYFREYDKLDKRDARKMKTMKVK